MVMKELIRCDEETQKTFLKEVGSPAGFEQPACGSRPPSYMPQLDVGYLQSAGGGGGGVVVHPKQKRSPSWEYGQRR